MLHEAHCKNAQSEGVGDPGGDQTAPGFIHHRTVGNFIRQTRVARHAVNAPVTKEAIVSRQFQIRVPATVRVIAAHAAAARLVPGDTIVVFVLIVAVPLHANTRRQRQVTVGVTVQPGEIPVNTVAVIQRIAGNRRAQEAIGRVVDIRKTGHHGRFTFIQSTHLLAVAVARLEVHWRPVGRNRQFIVGVIPQVVTPAQTVEPEVFALITNDRHRIDIRIILLIRMLNDPYASPKSELPVGMRRAGGRRYQHAECQKFDFSHNPYSRCQIISPCSVPS